MMMVVVIIGILALVIIPKYENTKGRAYIAAMKSDLHNLATAEEGFLLENFSYTTNIAVLNYHGSNFVTVNVVSADGRGWTATATHERTDVACSIFIGSATPIPPADIEGAPKCQ